MINTITPAEAYAVAVDKYPEWDGVTIRGQSVCVYGSPMIPTHAVVVWPDGVKEWPNQGPCELCGEQIGIIYTSRDGKRFCGSECRSERERNELVSALQDAVRLIEHLGGNAGCQTKALSLVSDATTESKGEE